MFENTNFTSDEKLDKSASSTIANSFERRAITLVIVGLSSIFLIVLLVLFAIASFYHAESLTDSQIDVVDRKLARLISDQSELSSELVPHLYDFFRIINAFDQSFERQGLAAIEKKEFNRTRDAGKYNYASTLRAADFSSQKALKMAINRIVAKAPLHEIVVIQMNLLLIGLDPDDYPDIKSAKILKNGYILDYFWSFKSKDLPKVNAAIDATDLDGLFDAENVDALIKRRYANTVQIEELRARREAFKFDKIFDSSSAEQNYRSQLNLNRFGPLVFVSILIAILSSFYKYNMRLATYYLARHDALRLQPTQKSLGFVRLAVALTPMIDFTRNDKNSMVGQLFRDK